MKPYYEHGGSTIYHGDCRNVLPMLASDSVDSIVTDPPYGLEFMGKEWDAPWQVSSKSSLFGKRNSKLPGWGTTRNPTCRTCGGRLRGANKCICETPDWDEAPEETRLRQMRGFQTWCEQWARECLRVLKPGGHLLAFGGTRTYHRLACAIEDAGFEIRDQVDWIYGSGFPKSLDIGKQIDKRVDWTALRSLQVAIKSARLAKRWTQGEAARRCGIIGSDEFLGGEQGKHAGGYCWFETGLRLPSAEQYQLLKNGLTLGDDCDGAFTEAEREVIGHNNRPAGWFTSQDGHDITAPATPEAQQWDGFGTALKPSHEPVCLARKPLEGTVAENVLKWGVGGLNIDGCRIQGANGSGHWGGHNHGDTRSIYGEWADENDQNKSSTRHLQGRWPANVLFDEPAAAILDEQNGTTSITGRRSERSRNAVVAGTAWGVDNHRSTEYPGDSGGASRFFYVAKAPQSERWFYCRECQAAFPPGERENHWHGHVNEKGEKSWDHLESHPTQKPEKLMAYLVRLVTPPNGIVLDPFVGSGTTPVVAEAEGFRSVGIELGEHNCAIAAKRLQQEVLVTEAV